MGNYISSFAIALLAIFSITISGCGNNSSLANVSGTITYEGKPVPKLSVFFSPQPVGDNIAPGPYSHGSTDADGKFTLKTRHKDAGALIGSHGLSFQYTDIGEEEMNEIRIALASKKKNKKTAKLNGRPVLTGCKTIIDVPAGGHEDLKLELSEMLNEQ